MAIIIDGKQISLKVRDTIKNEVESIKNVCVPSLAVIIVGNDPASTIYVNNKKKACEQCGITSFEYRLDEKTSQKELLDLIDMLNKDDNVNGVLCQMPLPSHIDDQAIIRAINPLKDVDGFHPQNVGRIMQGDFDFLPCTPAGVMELLRQYDISIDGKHCVIIGRSNIVGKPQSMLMLHSNATVTICHSKTRNLKDICRDADILVACLGKPLFVTDDMVKEGAVVIDVGINRDKSGKILGDVDFLNVKDKASYITPVPGGVGPMTITMLLKNTIKAAKLQNNIDTRE